MSTGAEGGRPPRSLAVLVATGFGAGRVPAMPGTAGTLLAVPLFAAMFGADVGRPGQVVVAALLALACVPLCTAAEKAIGTKDPPSVVCDEYAAYLLVLACSPEGWAYWVGSFALFRAFDIAKPWPLRLAQDRLPSGWGIMADDVLAALYATSVLWIGALAL